MPPNYDKMLVRELKGELEKRKIPVFGTRKTLVNKLKSEDQTGYGLLTVPELKIKMTAEGILDVSGDKSTLKNRMRSKLANRGYQFLPTDDLHTLCQERDLNHSYVESRSKLIGKLVKSDTPKVPKVSSNPYSGLSSSTSYSQSQDATPVVMTVIGSVIAFMLVLGCIGMMEEDEDSYSSSSSSSSGSSSGGSWNNDCFGGDAANRWCADVELDLCVYHDTSSDNWYYQELHWYGC